MILKVLMSRSGLLTGAAVGMLVGISVLRFQIPDPGVMLFAAVPITLLAVTYGVVAGLAAAAVASAMLLCWGLTQGHLGIVEAIDEPALFFMLGALSGIYAHGALGDLDLRHAVRRAELRRAIGRGEVVFHYQPLADACSRQVVGLEALARWEHSDRGRIEPAGFIPLAEGDERTIWELTLLTLNRSLADASTWGDVASELAISINLSPVSLRRRDLAPEFSRILQAHQFPASRLNVEVTETALVALPARAADALDSLKQLGIKIVLDDFGTGHSSITRLGRLPFDTLKVDLSLVGLPSASDANRILTAMIGLGRALALEVVAERVEDDQTWEQVAGMGFDLVQGFQLCRPLPADEVRDWLQRPGAPSPGSHELGRTG